MTLKNVQKRLLLLVVLLPLSLALAAAGSLLFLNKTSYQVAVTFGVVPVQEAIRYENVEINKDNKDPKLIRYAAFTGVVSEYFVKRYASLEVQTQIARNLGISTDNLKSDQPFYAVRYVDLGYVGLILETGEKQTADGFYQASFLAFQSIVESWNHDHELFALKLAQQPFPAEYQEIRTPLQLRILPLVLAVLLTTGSCFAWPALKNKLAL